MLNGQRNGRPNEAPSSEPAQSTAGGARSLSLRKGGGAIQGIGEKFAANPGTGTGAMTAPDAISPGGSGFGPQRSISDSGTGNGPFGIGWTFRGLEKTFPEPCLKLPPGGANEVDAGAPPDIVQLSLWQVERAVASLSDGERIALMKIARLYARKTPYDKEDLIQEAFARVLSGRRAWTKGTGPVLFLGGVIRSIAWEWKSEGPLHGTPSTDLKTEERNANAAIDAAKIIALFDDDPVARNMVAAMMDGARGEELQAISGLGKVAYESKRTKIRRRVEKFFDAEP